MMEKEVLVFNKEEDKKTLKEVGCNDLIEEMKCKNCKFLIEQYGKYCCKLKPTGKVLLDSNGLKQEGEYEIVDLDSHCWNFDKMEFSLMRKIYEDIKDVLKFYVDTKEENYEIISLWIIGTWLHDTFETYPYLFFNAMKGSGKTRVLKLIKELSKGGDMLASLSEAVMFRTTGTLCIDEFEGISNKDKNSLRELLNTAYKRGGKVKRMRKKKVLDGEQQVVEEFSTFRPIVMANISGMEEVLGDRCISLVFEKSSNKNITRKIENFSTNPQILKLKQSLSGVVRCSVVVSQNIYSDWNSFVNNQYSNKTTLNDTTTLTTPNNTEQHLFKRIFDTEINGRNLELFFPLLLIASEINLLDRLVEIMKTLVEERKEDDIIESTDINLYEFISKQTPNEWYRLKELTNLFRTYIHYDPEDENKNWLNYKWFGKALKRLNLVGKKRRLDEGREVMLDVEKAKKKMEIFR